MKKIFTVFAAAMLVMSLSAENYFLKSTWGQGTASWKQMIEDEGSYILLNEFFDGKDVAINTVASDEGARTIQVKNIQALINYDEAELAAGDSVLFVYDPQSYNAYDETQSGLIAMVNYKKGYAIKNGKVWKNMIEDDGSYAYGNVAFAGNVAIANGHKIRPIKNENIQALINFEEAELAIGDSVLFVYDPESYSSYDETQSGLLAMINYKAGYAIKVAGAWKNMTVDPEDADWWTLENITFDGNNVQLAHASKIDAIKPANINAYINYEDAELSAGDSVMFIFRPSLANDYNEKESGMQAMITYKNGYALKSTWGAKTASWKNMAMMDADTYVIENVMFDGKDVVLLNGTDFRTIQPANIIAYMMPSYDEAILEAGDSIVFMYTPSEYSQYNVAESGLNALIFKKHGYALKSGWGSFAESWKEMTKMDEDTYIIENVLFYGGDVKINNFASDEGARTIKVENIKAYMLPGYDEATLEAGDSIIFMYTPSEYAAMDPTKSGLNALITKKHGYALKSGWGDALDSWKEMVMQDSDTYIIENVLFDGGDVKINTIAGEKGARTIKAENIKAYMLPSYDEAVLEAGDSVVFMYTPSEYNQYDETESGLNALILKKHGYAIKVGSVWNELTVDPEDADWWTLENALYIGGNVKINNFAGDKGARSIKPENIKTYINYEDAELSAGDSVMFIFRPSLVNAYDETESGLNAMITNKAGYALKSTWGEKNASWKNMYKQDEDTYIIENVVFDGKDVVLLNGTEFRTIKVENIKAYLLPSYDDAVLEAGDSIVFMYTPSEYNRYDETQSGLSALIIKKHEAEGFEAIEAAGKAVKVLQNGQLFIIRDEKVYNAAGVVVK